jgi:ferredoxin-NADP reductase
VLKLRPTPDAPLLRSYSLSGEPSDARYRVSIKRHHGGVAGAYVSDGVKVGDILDVAAPRGGFLLQPSGAPVVLRSAGIGVTPVLAMLHALAVVTSPRDVWWIHGARDGGEHPFAAEVRARLQALPHAHCHISYSPGRGPAGYRFRRSWPRKPACPARIGRAPLRRFLPVRPPAFMTDLTAGLAAWSVADSRVHREAFGAGPALTPGIATTSPKPPHPPIGAPGTGPQHPPEPSQVEGQIAAWAETVE